AIHRCLQAAFFPKLHAGMTPAESLPLTLISLYYLFHCTIYILPFCKLWAILFVHEDIHTSKQACVSMLSCRSANRAYGTAVSIPYACHHHARRGRTKV